MTQAPDSSTCKARVTNADRWELLRDVTVFQLKLLLDAVRDVVLSPLSLIAAAAGLIGGGERPRRYLEDLIRVGRRTDRWINLFGEFDQDSREAGVDALVAEVEKRVVDQHARGGVTASAKDVIDRSLDAISARRPRD
jgi:hypothetical protein